MDDSPTVTGQRRLEYMPLADLLAARHPRNVKGHDLDTIDAMISRFGYTIPVLIDERTGYVAAGHGRLAVLERRTQQLDGPGAPQGILTTEAGVWLVPTVRGWASADDDELVAYLIGDNWSAITGGWTDGLAEVLAELVDTPQGLPPGITSDDLDTMLAELATPDFQPTDGSDQPRLDRKFHLVCNNCGTPIDPATAERVDQ